MKILKKLISVISSVAIVATMASALTVNAADPAVTGVLKIKPVVTQEDDGEYTVAINLDTTNVKKGNRVGVFSFWLDLNVFDTSHILDTTYDDEIFEDVYDNLEFLVVGRKDFNPGDGINVPNGVFKYTYQGTYLPLAAASNVVTIKNLKLAEGKKEADINLAFSKVQANVGTAADNQDAFDLSYGNVEAGTWPEKAEEPDPTPVQVPVTPVKNGDSDVFEGANENGTDRAVAAIASTQITKAINAENDEGITWKIDVTPQDGKSYTGYKTLKTLIGNVEANATLKVGLIVSYSAEDFASVTITGMEY